MTAEEAAALGYEVIWASAFEAGLIKEGRGVRTWYVSEFGGALPGLDHPEVQRTIELQEGMENFFKS